MCLGFRTGGNVKPWGLGINLGEAHTRERTWSMKCKRGVYSIVEGQFIANIVVLNFLCNSVIDRVPQIHTSKQQW